MDDAGAVSGIESVGDLGTEIEQILERQRPTRDTRLQRFPFEQLHHHELLPLMLADVVERADMRMTQRRDDSRFAQEAVHRLRIRSRFDGQQLDCDVTPEARVLSFIHHPHAAAAKLGEDAIVRDGEADHRNSLAGRGG